MDLQGRADDLEQRVDLLERERDQLRARVTRLERASVHQLETRALLDRVEDTTGVPATTSSQHWHDE